MPRQPRSIAPGTTYHLISRFVDREWFIRTTSERDQYLKLLGNALEGSDWRLMSYAIMSNHIHLGAIAGAQPLDAWVRQVHAPFADFMNRAYDRIGVMFVRGPKAHPVAPDLVGELIAYIHRNPVRAGVCSNAADSAWTSHRAYLGAAPVPAWLHVSQGLAAAGLRDPRDFDVWVNDPARAESARFSEQHYAATLKNTRDTARTARTAACRAKALAIATAAASVVGLTLDQLRSSSRCSAQVLGRSVAVRCAVAVGVSGVAIAEALGLSQQRVSMLARENAPRDVRALCGEVTSRTERRCLVSSD